MFEAMTARWRALRDPRVRKARRVRRRQAWESALTEAEARSGRQGPAATQVYMRSMRPDHRDADDVR